MSTRGNALAGSLAATLEAIEIHKLVSGVRENSIAGSEVLFDASGPAHYVNGLSQNPGCRFSHERLFLQETSVLTLGEAFDLTPGPCEQKSFQVPDSPFVSRLICDGCDHAEERWRLRVSLDVFSLACPRCTKPRAVRGFDLADRLMGGDLPSEALTRPLADLGLRAGDVFGIEVEHAATRHFILADSEADSERGDVEAGGVSLVIAGLGNIGSHLVPLAARNEAIATILLSDPDVYEPGQQFTQDIPSDAVGRAKAEVQAERVRAIRPEVQVEAFVAPVERLPLGKLRGAIVVSCLDSAAARLSLAARAWRVGSPFVDAAVGGGSSLLVRTNVYIPSADAACFECSFDASDYESLEQVFPCEAEANRDANESRYGQISLQSCPLPGTESA